MLPDQYKSLKLIAECPVCRRKNFPSDIKLVEARDDAHLLHVRCKNCHSSIMVMLLFSMEGMNIVGVLTDLGPEEAAGFLKRGPLGADDVLNAHELLQSKNFFADIVK